MRSAKHTKKHQRLPTIGSGFMIDYMNYIGRLSYIFEFQVLMKYDNIII